MTFQGCGTPSHNSRLYCWSRYLGQGASCTRGCLPRSDTTLNPHNAWYKKPTPVTTPCCMRGRAWQPCCTFRPSLLITASRSGPSHAALARPVHCRLNSSRKPGIFLGGWLAIGLAPCEGGASHHTLFESAAELAAATSIRPTRDDSCAVSAHHRHPLTAGSRVS